MTYLFGEKRLELLHKYKKEILLRFLVATIIYAVGVSLFIAFSYREVMYLFPILLGIYTMFYFGYLFYFILMYYSNYRGNKKFIEKLSISELDLVHHRARLIKKDYIMYRMYGVYCHNVTLIDLDTMHEVSLFIPSENIDEIDEKKIYNVDSYLSVMVSYEVSK